MGLSEENQRLVEEKVARLEKALILETRADERLRLEHEIKTLESQLTGFSSTHKINKTNSFVYIELGILLFCMIILVVIWNNQESKPKTPASTLETPSTIIQTPTNKGIAIQGSGTVNIYQGETK